jgi:zinc protease
VHSKRLLSVLSLVALLGAVQAPALAAPVPWSQEVTHREADPAVRFGTLPNGLRYAIMHNETPSQGVSMRMRIGAGSLVETDEQQGLAHVLEHMAFRGSKNIADGDMVRILERQGLTFGADTNAFTAQDETVYTFDFPRNDATALETGFSLFREIGDRLKLDPSALAKEKGVVLSEERLRDVPGYRAAKANLDNMLAGTRAPQRWPIGLVKTVKEATAARVRAYYTAHYRPDNATLIVVGNINVDAVEADIRQRFSDWHNPTPEPHVDMGQPHPKTDVVEHVEPGAPDSLSLTWVRPADTRPETVEVDRESLLREIGLTVLNLRLSDRATQPGSPFVGAGAGETRSLLGIAALSSLSLSTTPEKWQAALDEVTGIQRTLLRDGVQPAELQRAITVIRTQFQTAVSRSATRTNAQIAGELLGTVNDNALYTSAQQDLSLLESILKDATPQNVNAALRSAFAGQGPLLFRSAQAKPLTPKVLEAALKTAYTRPLGAAQAEKTVSWPYTQFGQPSAITDRHEDADLKATVITFANGTRLVVKPTQFAKDAVQIVAQFGVGRAGTPLSLQHAMWAVPQFTLGGLGQLSLADLNQWAQVNSKELSTNLAPGVLNYSLTGSTRTSDLLTQMQVLNAYARDPGFRPEMGEKIAAIGPMYAGQLATNAGAAFSREVVRVLTGGDRHFGGIPTAQDIAATRPEVLSGPASISIVGDVTVDQAIAATEATFAAGTVGPQPAQPTPKVTPLSPKPIPYVVMHGGRADQAYDGRYWPLPDYSANPKLAHTADVAAAVLSSRMLDTLRESKGITYSPSADASTNLDVPGLSYFSAVIETPKENFPTFASGLKQLVHALAQTPPTADELERARQPLIEAHAKALEKNGFWTGTLLPVLRSPVQRDYFVNELPLLQSVTAKDVQAFFATYVDGKPFVEVQAVSDKKAGAN